MLITPHRNIFLFLYVVKYLNRPNFLQRVKFCGIGQTFQTMLRTYPISLGSITCNRFIANPWNTLWDKSREWQQTSLLKSSHYLCNSMLILDKGFFIYRKNNTNWLSYNYRRHCDITLSTLRLVTSRVVPVHYLATPELQDDKSPVWTGH